MNNREVVMRLTKKDLKLILLNLVGKDRNMGWKELGRD